MKDSTLNYAFFRRISTALAIIGMWLLVAGYATAQVDCAGVSEWDAGASYNGGTQVVYNGNLYKANWWTQNQNPESHSGDYQEWTLLGSCGDVNPAPTVDLTFTGGNFDLGVDINITANASDDGTVTKVEFFAGNTKIGEDTSAPYSLTWTNVAVGNYSVTAKATDNEGASSTSSAVSVSVTDPNVVLTPPTVSVSAPASANEGTVTVSASASDADGNVTKVEFYAGSTKIGEDTSAPYSVNWTATEGTYSLTAKATDNDGLMTTSSATSITINKVSGGNCDAPQYVEGTEYAGGQEVQNENKVYSCDVPGWCSSNSGWAYAPGTGSAWQDAWTLVGDCDGGGNPDGNKLPTVSITAPTAGSRVDEGATVTINVSATDEDGSVVKVEFFEGTTKIGEDTSAPFALSWTPASTGFKSLTAVATDDSTGVATSEAVSVRVVSGNVVPAPDRVIVGYWHNWDLASVPFIRLRDISDDYNVVCIAFAEPKLRDIDNTMIFEPVDASGKTNPTAVAQFKEDVAYLQGKGKKIILSIGGANGVVHLDDADQTQRFISSMTDLINEYGFDGLDIDLEGSSLTLEAGDDDFKNPTTPRNLNFIQAIEQIYANQPDGFMLTSAPETAYVQGGTIAYGGSWGGYLPILYALKDKLDYVHVQLYNTGSIRALDGKNYSQASADFIVAMCEMMLQGFETKSVAGRFPAFRQDQVAIGLPSNPPAAPAGGYTTPAEVHKALDYLMKGIPFGGSYQLVNPNGYPGLRGMMTWSINWDKTNGYEYGSNHSAYFNALGSARVEAPASVAKSGDAYSYRFNIQEAGYANLELYDENGNKVANFDDQYVEEGIQTVKFKTEDLENGTYKFRFTSGNQVREFPLIKE